MSEQDQNPRPDDPGPTAEARAAAEGPEANADAALRAQFDEAARQRDEALDQLKRVQAEFVNFQRRSRTQAEADRSYAAGPLATDLFPVLDNFERAIEAARQSGAEAIITGLDMVHRQLIEALAKHGVEPIPAVGTPFDPNRHEALTQMPDAERPEGTVVAELGRGYTLRDRVLRPSRVAISKKPDNG